MCVVQVIHGEYIFFFLTSGRTFDSSFSFLSPPRKFSHLKRDVYITTSFPSNCRDRLTPKKFRTRTRYLLQFSELPIDYGFFCSFPMTPHFDASVWETFLPLACVMFISGRCLEFIGVFTRHTKMLKKESFRVICRHRRLRLATQAFSLFFGSMWQAEIENGGTYFGKCIL